MSKVRDFLDRIPVNVVFVRSAYNYDTKLASDEAGLTCFDPSLTQQQFKDDSDPNTIIATFARDPKAVTDLLTAGGNPAFGDFLSSSDFHTTLTRVRAADSAFMNLPAKIRDRFHNDPGEFIEFFNDEKNLPEAIKLGLMKEGTTLPEEPLAPVVTQIAKGDKGSAPLGAPTDV